MADEESLRTKLAKLRDVRAKGILSYAINGRQMTYRSDADLASAIADIESQIAALGGGRIRKIRVRSTKGLT